jgi:t-SNARE complex subunit (syntaxin)
MDTYKGYEIDYRNAPFGGVKAIIKGPGGQVLREIVDSYGEAAFKKAKMWIDNQDESDANLFLGSLAARDQEVVKLEQHIAELEATLKRVSDIVDKGIKVAEYADIGDEVDATEFLGRIAVVVQPMLRAIESRE